MRLDPVPWTDEIANQDILRGEVNAWQLINAPTEDVIRVDWRFTTEDARIKRKVHLYRCINTKTLNH